MAVQTPTLDASTDPVKKPVAPGAPPSLPVAGLPGAAPATGTPASTMPTTGQVGPSAGVPLAPPMSTTDPMAFMPPPGATLAAPQAPPGPAQQAPVTPPAGGVTAPALPVAPTPGNNAPLTGETAAQTAARNTAANPATGSGPLVSGGAGGSGNADMDAYARGEIDYPTLQKRIAAQNATLGQTGLGVSSLADWQKLIPGHDGPNAPEHIPGLTYDDNTGSYFNNDGTPYTGDSSQPTSAIRPLAPGVPGYSGDMAPVGAAALGGGAKSINPNDLGPAGDTNPGSQLPTTGAGAPPSATVNGATPTASSPGYGATLTDPANPLTAQTLSVDPTADRFKIANDQLQSTIKNVLDPAMEARRRDSSRYEFGAGRGVSGEARTAQGNITSDYGHQIADLTSGVLNTATTGTIQDAKDREAVAAQQQGFQAGQQRDAFGQAVTGQTLADSEESQSFQQALQKLLVGSSGDPAQIQLLLAQLFGGESAQSSEAAQKLAQASAGTP